MLKIIVVLLIFSRIISDQKASSETTVARLFLLVMCTAAWSVATAMKCGTDLTGLESRMTSLEARVAAMEKKKTE